MLSLSIPSTSDISHACPPPSLPQRLAPTPTSNAVVPSISLLPRWCLLRNQTLHTRRFGEEISTIKLWLPCAANHLEHAEADGVQMLASNISELFGPCSTVKHSPTRVLSHWYERTFEALSQMRSYQRPILWRPMVMGSMSRQTLALLR
jgi:hypothetical protein